MKTAIADKRQQGFTLVELLVVISIIALLIAILLPALGKARQAAQAVVCGSNHRQVGQLLYIYIDSNKGYVPPPDYVPYSYSVFTDIKKFYGWRMALEGIRAGSGVGPVAVASRKSMFVCPSLPSGFLEDPPSYFKITGMGMNVFLNYRFAYTGALGGYDWPYPGTAGLAPQYLTNTAFDYRIAIPFEPIKHPGKVIFIGDTTDQAAPTAGNPYYRYYIGPTKNPAGLLSTPYNQPSIIGDRHSGSATTLWGDGHATLQKNSVLQENYSWYYPGDKR